MVYRALITSSEGPWARAWAHGTGTLGPWARAHGTMGPGPCAHGTGTLGPWDRDLGTLGPGPWGVLHASKQARTHAGRHLAIWLMVRGSWHWPLAIAMPPVVLLVYSQVSRERIGIEVDKMLTAGDDKPVKALRCCC